MESSIAGALILGVLIVVVVLMSQAYVASNTMLGTAMLESIELADERSRTALSVDSAKYEDTRLTAIATNRGDVPITNYPAMDIFVDNKRFAYATSTPVEGTWTVDDRSPWNPGETREITVYRNVSTTTTVVISSSTGGAKVVPTPTPTPTPPTPTPDQITVVCNNLKFATTTTGTTTSITITCTP